MLSQVPVLEEDLARGEHLFPAGRLDQDLQQVDLRDTNSWRLTLAEVPTAELLEVQLVNAVAPFVLNARLRPLPDVSEEIEKSLRQTKYTAQVEEYIKVLWAENIVVVNDRYATGKMAGGGPYATRREALRSIE